MKDAERRLGCCPRPKLGIYNAAMNRTVGCFNLRRVDVSQTHEQCVQEDEEIRSYGSEPAHSGCKDIMIII